MADRKDTPMERLKARSEAAKQRLQDREQEPRQLFLPGMDEFMRAMPNPVADSSLFAPVARGVKKMHAGAVLASRAGPVISLTAMPPGTAQVPLERLLIERATSTNTAAAGGNASLMTMA